MRKSKSSRGISAFLVVRNEEENIERALKSLQFCDEIIVVDQKSTDNTVKIVRKYTRKIFSDKCWGYADPSRKMAASMCRYPWLLNLDADEEITKELKTEILQNVNSVKFDAFSIHRNFYWLNKLMKYTGQDDWVLRLHKKGAIEYVSDIHVCAIAKKNIKIGKMKNSMNHYAVKNFSQFFDKFKRYTTIQAKTDKKYNTFPRKYFGILYTPAYYFIYNYILKKGFLDGWKGFLWAVSGFFYELTVYFKVWFYVKSHS